MLFDVGIFLVLVKLSLVIDFMTRSAFGHLDDHIVQLRMNDLVLDGRRHCFRCSLLRIVSRFLLMPFGFVGFSRCLAPLDVL